MLRRDRIPTNHGLPGFDLLEKFLRFRSSARRRPPGSGAGVCLYIERINDLIKRHIVRDAFNGADGILLGGVDLHGVQRSCFIREDVVERPPRTPRCRRSGSVSV